MAKSGFAALWAASSARSVGGLEGQHELGEVGGAALQHAERRADAAGHGELQQRLQLGGTGDADVDGQGDAGGARGGRPRR